MDPVAGIGLAASVIQFVNFGINAVGLCRQVYRQGTATEHDTIKTTADQLVSLSERTERYLIDENNAARQLSEEENELIRVARRCRDCSERLQGELSKLQARPRASALEVVRKASRAVWKRNDIEKINNELASHKALLESSLLYRLSRKFDVHSIQNEQRFENLDTGIRHIITCLASSQTSLTALTIQQGEKTRHHVTSQVDALEEKHAAERTYDELMKSLFYPEIFYRQEQVASNFDGFQHSYEWIFDDPGRSYPGYPEYRVHWDDFATWLRSDSSLYWISGKAGSGKSTLMNYICGSNIGLDLLKEWCPKKQLLTPTFFFWSGGKTQQKTLNGFMRSLLYQSLKAFPRLSNFVKNEPLYAWTDDRLLEALLSIIKQQELPLAFCLFIDGLDEFDCGRGRYDNLLKVVKALAESSNVKVCVSSRPILAFEEAFSNMPGLRLQDLNDKSIQAYVDLQLNDTLQSRISRSNETEKRKVKGLIRHVGRRAGGIFLWAVVVAKEIRNGLRDFVNIDELTQIVEAVPEELESLFVHLLQRIKPAYQRDAALYLQITLYYQDLDMYVPNRDYLDLCGLYLTQTHLETGDVPFRFARLPMETLETNSRDMKTRVLSHTSGFLDVIPVAHHKIIYGRHVNKFDAVALSRIDLLHRTVRDFLLVNKEAQALMSRKGSSEAHIRLAIAKSLLATIIQFANKDEKPNSLFWPSPVFHPFLRALSQIAKAEELLHSPQTQLMESLSYHRYAQDFAVTSFPKGQHESPWPYMLDQAATSVDLVGMAATVGMRLWVYKQLRIRPNQIKVLPWHLQRTSFELKSRERSNILHWIDRTRSWVYSYHSFVDCKRRVVVNARHPSRLSSCSSSSSCYVHSYYQESRECCQHLFINEDPSDDYYEIVADDYDKKRRHSDLPSWIDSSLPWNPTENLATRSPLSLEYRKTLSYCLLEVEKDDHELEHVKAPSDTGSLAETYLLNCCRPLEHFSLFPKLELIQTLLHLGADPMAEIYPGKGNRWDSKPKSFWAEWLEILHSYRWANHERKEWGVLTLSYQNNTGDAISHVDVFKITKSLVENGADIHRTLRDVGFCWLEDSLPYLRRSGLEHEQFDLRLTAPVQFLLWECFKDLSEFRDFSRNIEAQIGRPVRKLKRISMKKGHLKGEAMNKGGSWQDIQARLNDEEASGIWPLLEKWERTGSRGDMNSLQAKLRQIWQSHHPELEAKDDNGPVYNIHTRFVDYLKR